MNIRKLAKKLGYDVVGKLRRVSVINARRGEKCYVDEDGNEYYLTCGELTIITADGGVA